MASMHTNRCFQKLTATLLAAPLVLGLSSCGEEVTAHADAPLTTDGAVIITNSRANVPVPSLSSGNQRLVRQVLQAGHPVEVVAVDGKPERVVMPELQVTGNNDRTRDRSLSDALEVVSMAITKLPDSPEANAYDAFAVARDTAASRGLRNPTIICLGCGIDTVGPLSMTAEGAVRASSGDYVDYLDATGQLVRFDQSGFETVQVVLTSIGATAAPQEPLSPSDMESLTGIWRGVLEAGGAEVSVDPFPLSGESVQTEHPVTPVQLPSPPAMPSVAACQAQTIDFDGASSARFEYNVAVWMDEAAAREALRPLAEWLTAGPNRIARIAGTTASAGTGDPDEGKELSLLRARAAADMLISLGVGPEQIVELQGLGPNYPGRVPDMDADGNPIPEARARNRKILITLQEVC